MFYEGDQHPLNPARYLPTPFHTKFAQERTALSQYIQQESVGTRMRRWERPFHDFLMPYLRGTVERTTGPNWIPAEVEHRRDLDTLADMMTYLQALNEAREPGPSPPGIHKIPRAGGRKALALPPVSGRVPISVNRGSLCHSIPTIRELCFRKLPGPAGISL